MAKKINKVLNKKVLKNLSSLATHLHVCADAITGSANDLDEVVDYDDMSEEEKLDKIFETFDNLQKYDLIYAVSLLEDLRDMRDTLEYRMENVED